jgi:DNA polymerase (family X)
MPVTNQKIAETLEQLADLLEFTGTNPFRLRAYRNAARIIGDLTESVSGLIEKGDDLTRVEGIGESVATKCMELVNTGRLKQLDELLTKVPASVLDLLRVPGLGPKKAAALFNALSITSLDELRAACEAGKVRELEGFAAKTERTILEGIAVAESANRRKYWADADGIANRLREHLATADGVQRIELAGSYRRRKETVGDLDVIATTSDPAPVMDRLASFPDIEAVLARGDTKMSVRMSSAFQIDLRVVPEESFGAALIYFTGSKDHNIVLRGLAHERGMVLNEWGLFKVTGKKEKRMAGETEEGVYSMLGLPWFPPEIREARKEFLWAEEGEIPKLVDLADLRGDLHMHTSATDGSSTIREMAAAAMVRGRKYIAITDHSRRVAMANGLNEERLLAQWSEIDSLRDLIPEIRILKGIEVDILENGDLDLPDSVLSDADWVTASIHYGGNQPAAQITARVIGAITNPNVDCISHPTGRLLNQREPYAVEVAEVIAAASANRKMLEVNAHPARLDLNDIHCAMAREAGVPVVINSDAHNPNGLDVLRYGVNQARRGGLTRADVANCWSWDEIVAWFASGVRPRL